MAAQPVTGTAGGFALVVFGGPDLLHIRPISNSLDPLLHRPQGIIAGHHGNSAARKGARCQADDADLNPARAHRDLVAQFGT